MDIGFLQTSYRIFTSYHELDSKSASILFRLPEASLPVATTFLQASRLHTFISAYHYKVGTRNIGHLSSP